MFERLFSRPKPPVEPVPDLNPAQDDLELRVVMETVKTGDWGAAKTLIDAAGTRWDLRGRRVALLSPGADDGAWLEAWLAAEPDNPTAVLLRACSLAGQAGAARGGASAANTTAEQFAKFDELLEESRVMMHRAVELAPHDPVPWTNMLSTYMSRGQEYRADFSDTFAQAKRLDPVNFDLYTTATGYLCEKWYGSHEEMFAVAREVSAVAPPGAPSVMMPYLAHFEYAMREFSWDKRSVEARAACRDYLRRPEVAAELDGCVAKWRAVPPQPLGRSMTARHWAALGYTLRGMAPQAKAMLDEIGPYLGVTPVWGYFYSKRADGFLAAWRWANNVMVK
jgi:hypothetical protein